MAIETGSKKLADVIEQIYEAATVLSETKGSEPIYIEIGDRQFWVVAAEQEDKLDLTALRAKLLGGSWNVPLRITQIVGDSGTPFRADQVDAAKQIVEEACGANTTVVEYGFTECKHDANWLVGELLQKLPKSSSMAIANVVGQTIDALRSEHWAGCDHVSKFVLLVNRDGSRSKFGQDTWLSDGILSKEAGDNILCFEGGVQAFEQCCNVLNRGMNVHVVTGLRARAEASRFSAAKLLSYFQTAQDKASLDAEVGTYLYSCSSLKFEQRASIVASASRLGGCNHDFSRLITATVRPDE